MSEDPIVREIHETRRELLAEFGGLDGYLRHVSDVQAELKTRVVKREPRKPVLTVKMS